MFFPDFLSFLVKFPDFSRFSLTTFKFPDFSRFSRFSRLVDTLYASMAWSPDLAGTHVEALQRVQNSALRVATGCTKSTPVPHLHAETRVLPVRDHLDMRGT